MKKQLLSLALISLGLSASAQSVTDLFTFTYEGKTIANGETIIVNEHEAGETAGTLTYACNIVCANSEIEPVRLDNALYYVTPANATELFDNEQKWGAPQFCYSGGAVVKLPDNPLIESSPANCLGGETESIVAQGVFFVPAEGKGNVTYELHLFSAADDAISEYRLEIQPTQWNEDEEEYDYITERMVINIRYVPKAMSGVEEIQAAEGATEYFDLQGRKITNPGAGLYIIKNGEKVSKQIIR